MTDKAKEGKWVTTGGVVVSGAALVGATVTNLTTGETAQTGADGFFALTLQPGDVLTATRGEISLATVVTDRAVAHINPITTAVVASLGGPTAAQGQVPAFLSAGNALMQTVFGGAMRFTSFTTAYMQARVAGEGNANIAPSLADAVIDVLHFRAVLAGTTVSELLGAPENLLDPIFIGQLVGIVSAYKAQAEVTAELAAFVTDPAVVATAEGFNTLLHTLQSENAGIAGLVGDRALIALYGIVSIVEERLAQLETPPADFAAFLVFAAEVASSVADTTVAAVHQLEYAAVIDEVLSLAKEAGGFATAVAALADSTPPVIIPQVVGTLGKNDWYVSNVTVSWSVTDAESKITAQTGCDTVTVNEDTAAVTFSCTATSGGGTATASVTIKRDATPPTPIHHGPFTVNEGFTVRLDGTGSTDALSGVASTAWALNSNSFDAGDPATFNGVDGPATFSVSLKVVDEAGNEATATTQVTVQNLAPAVTAGAIPAANEGDTVSLAPATFTDPGILDTHSATIDWGDGTGSKTGTVTEVAGSGAVSGSHIYADNGSYTVKVCVTDKDRATTCDTLTVTIRNVAPTVKAGVNQTINEGGTMRLGPATFSDPGFDRPETPSQENFTATIDFGEGTRVTGVVAKTPGGEGRPTTGTVSGSHAYGDNGVYRVTVCVTDDDQATTCDSFTVTVNNVNPAIEARVFLTPAITFLSGNDAFLGRKLVKQTHEAAASDPGSDDLRYNWTFIPRPDRFGGTLPPTPKTKTTTTFNDGAASGPFPFTDPAAGDLVGAHPHGTFPFASKDTASVVFNAPGVYVVDLLVRDDDGGKDSISLPKLIPDNFVCAKSHGFWKHAFEALKGKGNDNHGKRIDNATLLAYLDIITFASGVFSKEFEPAATIEEARALLWPNKNGNDDDDDHANKYQKALQEALAAWLNFARGTVLWDEAIRIEMDDEKEGTITRTFHAWMTAVEAILLSPDSTHKDWVRAKDIAEGINDSDEDNRACKGNKDD